MRQSSGVVDCEGDTSDGTYTELSSHSIPELPGIGGTDLEVEQLAMPPHETAQVK